MKEIKPLTSIRGVFAIYVAVYHMFPRTNSFIANGYLSVDLFFILSGFVMSYVYYKKFSCNIKTHDYFLYIKGRIARVYPLYAFVIILTSLLYFNNDIPLPEIKEYAIIFSFLQSFIDIPNNLISHAWSIAVEFIAYLIFPFAILILSKKAGTISYITLVTLAFTCLYLTSLKGYWGPLDVVSGGFAIVRCLSDYTLGIASFFTFKAVQAKLKMIVLDIILVFSIVLAFITLNFRGYDLVVVALFAFIIPLLSTSQGIIYKFMSLSPMVYLGEISYSIYLIHYPLCRKLAFIPAWFNKNFISVDTNYIALAMTIFISIITYHFVEVPCRDFIRGSFRTNNLRVS